MKVGIEAAVRLVPDTLRDGARVVSAAPTVARFGARKLRRVGRLTRLALPVVEALWEQERLVAESSLGLVVGTGLADLAETAGFLDSVAERGRRLASPQSFQRSVHGAVAGDLAILYGLDGYNMTVSQGRHAGLGALRVAALAVAGGVCTRCVCVAVDGVTDVLRQATEALGAEVVLGEGAAALLLVAGDGRLGSVAPFEEELPGPDPSLGVHGAADLMALVHRRGGHTL